MAAMSKKECLVRLLLAAGILFSVVLPLAAQWVNVTANLAEMPSECGNLCLLSVVPGQDKIIAGIAKRGLWQTTDGGATWTPLGQGAGSDVIINRPSQISKVQGSSNCPTANWPPLPARASRFLPITARLGHRYWNRRRSSLPA